MTTYIDIWVTEKECKTPSFEGLSSLQNAAFHYLTKTPLSLLVFINALLKFDLKCFKQLLNKRILLENL